MQSDTTLLSMLTSAVFSEFEDENSLSVDAFSRKVFRQDDNFPPFS